MTIPARYIVLLMTALVLSFAGCADDELGQMLDGPGETTVCTDFSRFIHSEGYVDTPGTARRSALAGNYLYVADGTAGVQIIDVGDPDRPVIVGVVDTPGNAADIGVSGRVIVVADAFGGIQILDRSNPERPVPIDTLGSSTARGVAVRDTLAYVAADILGLVVLGLSDPLSPRIIAVENTVGSAQDVVLHGDVAFVSDQVLGLRVVDIRVPTAPDTMAVLPLPGTLRGIDIHPATSTLFIAAGREGVHVIDVGDPDRPIIIGSVPAPSTPRDVAVVGDRLFVADRTLGVHVLNIEDPRNIRPVFDIATRGEAIGVNVFDGRLFVASTRGVMVVDASNPDPPGLLDTVPTAGDITGLYRAGEAIYVTSGTSGIEILDTSTPGAPVIRPGPTINGARQVVFRDSVAYVASSTQAVTVLDVRDLLSPTISGVIGGAANRLAVSESLLVTANSAGLAIFHIENPGPPLKLVTASGTPASDVALSGRYAYVAWGPKGLQIVDIANPAQARIVGERRITNGSANSVAVAGRYAFVAAFTFGLHIIDIQNPFAPVTVAVVPSQASAIGVFVDGGIAYVADSRGGVRLIDVTDPTNPGPIGALPVAGAGTGVAVDAFFMYAADSPGRVLITRAPCRP